MAEIGLGFAVRRGAAWLKKPNKKATGHLYTCGLNHEVGGTHYKFYLADLGRRGTKKFGLVFSLTFIILDLLV